ncbi:MAG: hypothetical protein ACTSYA_08945 [Candidatus Kariarchaeaceae archaeon]
MRRFFGKGQLKLSIICAGDAGCRIGNLLINSLKKAEADINSLAIMASDKKNKFRGFDRYYSITNNKLGFGRNIDEVKKLLNDPEKQKDLVRELERTISDNDVLTLVIASAGGTGSGSMYEVVKILQGEKFKLTPTLAYILPDNIEGSQVNFNAAMTLYDLSISSSGPQCPLIVLDNHLVMQMGNFEEMCYAKALEKLNLWYSRTIRDLIAGAVEEPTLETKDEFNPKAEHMLSVFNEPGISLIVASDIDQTGKEEAGIRITDFIIDTARDFYGISKDNLYKAKKSVILFNDLAADFQTLFEARKISGAFVVNPPYAKFVSNLIPKEELPYEATISVRAIMSGLPLPPRIISLMTIARDAYKTTEIAEDRLAGERINFDPKPSLILEEKGL